MEQVLYKRLLELRDKNLSSFHYPGHKGKNLYFDPSLLAQLDTTETFGTDDLQAPEEILAQTQDQASKLFGTKASFYGVGGSTMANYTAIASIARPGEKILVQRNSHRSVFQGAMLQNLDIETISPHYDQEKSLLTGIFPDELKKVLRENPEIVGAVFTNPSYYGQCLRLRELVKVCQSFGLAVIVDEAHGGHFHFTEDHHLSALESGADIVVQSAHKSLPAMTTTSLLHLNSDRIPLDRLRKFFNLYTTSSPSYILLLSIEAALAEMDDHGRDKWKETFALRDWAAAEIEKLGAEVYSGDGGRDLAGYDRSKLFFKVPGYRGDQLAQALYEKGVNTELDDGNWVLAVISTENTLEDFERLIAGIKGLKPGNSSPVQSLYRELKTEQVQSLAQAFNSKSKWVDLDDSLGQVVVDFLQLYPPGIPLILPGELMTQEILQLIKINKIVNVVDGQVRVSLSID